MNKERMIGFQILSISSPISLQSILHTEIEWTF